MVRRQRLSTAARAVSREVPRTTCDLTDQIARIRSGDTTAAELLHTSIGIADDVNERMGAVLSRFDIPAEAAARHCADRGDGALAGVPLGIKANIAVAEAVPTAQSRVHDPEFFHGQDADVVARLRDAGGVIACTTTMVEHAAGRPDPALDFPIPRNPWDPTRWPGGSSCGTAIAISLGIVAGGLGTDTSGSCRIPAAFCGVTGLRPAAGSMSMTGILPAAPSLDIVGPMARSVRDCRLLLEIMSGQEIGSSRTDSQTRVLVPTQILESEQITEDARCAFDEALATMGEIGIDVATVDLPFLDDLISTTLTIMVREMYEAHRDRLATRWNDYGRSFRRLALAGALVPRADYEAAVRSAEELSGRLGEVIIEGTALALPTWPSSAPPYDFEGGTPQDEWNLTAAFCATGNPALSLPMGFDRAGMPLSLQLVGSAPDERGHSGEESILHLGEAFQEVTDYHLRVPSIEQHDQLAAIADPDEHIGEAGDTGELPPELLSLDIPLTAADRATMVKLCDLLRRWH